MILVEFFPILSGIVTLFLMTGTGFIAFRTGYITREGASGLSSLLVNITLPCLIIGSMQVPLSPDRVSDIGWIFLIEAIYYLIAFISGVILTYFLSVSRFESGVVRFMLLFSNIGFMGYPVSYALFGEESCFYVTLVNIPFGFLVFTLGISLLRPDFVKLNDFYRILTPGLVASVIGLLFFFTGITIPSPLSDTLDLLGSVTTPLAMVVIGALLATFPIGTVFSDWRIWAVCGFRLAVIPCVLLLVITRLVSDPMLVAIPVLLAAMPVAANTVLMAEEYGVNAEFASKGVLLSTLLSLLTLPVVDLFLPPGS